jgi:hypothetical protein
LFIAVLILLVAGIFGLHILIFILKNKETPKISVILHSVFASSALTIIVVEYFKTKNIFLTISLLFLMTAALSGIFLVYKDIIKHKPPVKKIAIIHPFLAIIGLIFLIWFSFLNK